MRNRWRSGTGRLLEEEGTQRDGGRVKAGTRIHCPGLFLRDRPPVWCSILIMLAAPLIAFGQDEQTQEKRPANRLAGESSPYLLMHAHNPVDWYPWGPEAFEKAKAENKPIFLSIGYSSCYWCHVMERTVFMNEEIARYMNEHFVNVKVDREERPDLDDIYMLSLQVYQQLAGSSAGGGWPLSIFLTPEGNPIAGGTYFPPEDMPGRPGFPRVLKQVHTIWSSRQADVQRTAKIIADEVRRLSVPTLALEKTPVDESLVAMSLDAIRNAYDAEYGGFDFDPDAPEGPKFPVPSRILLVQSRIPHDPSGELDKMVDFTLERMAAGGIYDHVGGGFHRYSTDRKWLIPHFEKMLYDNAQLAEVYVEAYRRTNRQPYRDVAEGTLDFVLRDLTDADGGFYSALDAETDGVEGKYYVWEKDEVARIVGGPDAPAVLAVYGLEQPKPFEYGYVLHQPEPLSIAAERLQMPLAELQLRLAEAKKKLLQARQQRTPLLRDEKILTSWNGLMIRAFARAGQVLQRRDYLAAAERAAIYVLSRARNNEGRLLRSIRNDEGKLNAYLDDYAFLVSGLLALHEATGQEKWLNAARRLTDDQIIYFWDEESGGFFFTTHDHEQLIARTKNAYDSVIPAGNSVAAENLIRLARITGEAKYREYAARTFQIFAPQFKNSPAGMSYMAGALQKYLDAFGGIDYPPAATGDLFADAPQRRAGTGTPAETATRNNTDISKGRPSEERLVAFASADKVEAARHEKVRAAAYLASNLLVPGKSSPVAVVIEVAEGWHINANPAQPDFVIPTVLSGTFSTPKGALAELKVDAYPKGHTFKIEGIDEPLSVYEGRIILYGAVSVPAEFSGQRADATVTLRYQACNDANCLRPMRLTLKGTVDVARPTDQVQVINEGLFKEAGTRK